MHCIVVSANGNGSRHLIKGKYNTIMFSIFIGALIISLLHAVIPNHWLPVIAIGRKENWSLDEISYVTVICALAHGLSTVLIGVLLGFAGAKLEAGLSHFTSIIAPIILI